MNKKPMNQYDVEQLKAYRALPAKEKFRFLEEMNAFFLKAMPLKSKAVWKKLQSRGW